MALIVKQTKRLEHPTEPDTWFELSLPLTAGDMLSNPQTMTLGEVKLAGIERALTRWSYSEPVSTEAVRQLDIDTFNWLFAQVFDGSRLPPAEKKDSDSPSSPTTAPAGDDSPENSAI